MMSPLSPVFGLAAPLGSLALCAAAPADPAFQPELIPGALTKLAAETDIIPRGMMILFQPLPDEVLSSALKQSEMIWNKYQSNPKIGFDQERIVRSALVKFVKGIQHELYCELMAELGNRPFGFAELGSRTTYGHSNLSPRANFIIVEDNHFRPGKQFVANNKVDIIRTITSECKILGERDKVPHSPRDYTNPEEIPPKYTVADRPKTPAL